MSEAQIARLESMKQEMGRTYLCHPANRVKRVTPFRKSERQLREGLRVITRPGGR